MPEPAPTWELEDFLARFDAWADRQSPSVDLRYVVLQWVMGRRIDPFRGARREPGFANLWFAVVPGSHDKSGSLVTCSYWIEHERRVVRCDNFATLSPPFS